MNNELDDLRQLVAESFARFGREGYPFEARSAALRSARGYCERAWTSYAEMGWLGLRLPDEHGGMGADAQTVGALMETVGRHLLLEPLLAHAVLGAGALLRGNASLISEFAAVLIDGTVILAFADDGEVEFRDGRVYGSVAGVLHGDVANRLVVAATSSAAMPSMYLVDMQATGLERRAYRLVDGRGAALLRLDGVAAQLLGTPEDLDALRDERTAALCAEALGSVDHLVEATAAYLKVRKQFGRSLSSFQALQHRMSELVLLRDEIRALVHAAQAALSDNGPRRTRVISGAAAYVTQAARQVGNDAVQLHGGIGVTEELDISHHFRRLMVVNALLGGRDRHIERFAQAGADVAEMRLEVVS